VIFCFGILDFDKKSCILLACVFHNMNIIFHLLLTNKQTEIHGEKLRRKRQQQKKLMFEENLLKEKLKIETTKRFFIYICCLMLNTVALKLK